MNETDVNKRIADKLLLLRKNSGITVPKIANAIHKSVDSYYAYESGRREIPIYVLVELSAFYGISIDDIVDNEVTYNRQRAVSFVCYSEKGKEKVLVSEPEDGLIFYRLDECTVEYYAKCMNVIFNKKMLIQIGSATFPAIISYDEKAKAYVVFNTVVRSSKVYKPKAYSESVIVLGDYAGTISEKVRMRDFL